ncbi:HNH endonuclease, partial [Microbacterium sp. EYE_5]|nr:HNH endonuclease [Microbacterium sp. EYE_382]MCK6086995.1 HNH endonuclease [Microbacterium sp. EYE_384]MCK6125027.1 HNH endonuclease [Microbacterium sp. EYE_80]MCK6127758.1 HNH endonuclease [Microbacterium sp. EYE_79]MCK6142679.1 HNH endonuclease [Microbacterium sp. EYE_39]MCK6219404.1 HNH endonuclease [Microbacterium sp. EYE_5]MCK6229358.1 HNH endonuclease [Microbacterium sp. EYE_77]MCK6248442.1 HNH endonuclease [Microbacterium sp. EYE_78]
MTEAVDTPGGEDHFAVLAGILADVAEVEREAAAVQIRQLRILASAGHLAQAQAVKAGTRVRMHDMALRAIAAEVGGVMRVADRTVQRRIDDALVIIDGYPAA